MQSVGQNYLTNYLQVRLDNSTSKIIDQRMIDYLGENPFETDKY